MSELITEETVLKRKLALTESDFGSTMVGYTELEAELKDWVSRFETLTKQHDEMAQTIQRQAKQLEKAMELLRLQIESVGPECDCETSTQGTEWYQCYKALKGKLEQNNPTGEREGSVDIGKLYDLALKEWGSESQIGMLYEEMGELMQALNKLDRRKGTIEQVCQEIADVQIMTEQIARLFGEEAVRNIRREKLKKLEKFLTDLPT